MRIKNYTTRESIIDRNEDVEQIKELLKKAVKSQVHIVFSKTGYGKTSFSTKLAQESVFSSWNVIRVETQPKNANDNVPEGEYLEVIFSALMKHFTMQGHSQLFFKSYVQGGSNNLLEKMALNDTFDVLTSIESPKKALPKLIGALSKRRLGVGAFNFDAIIHDNSSASRSIKADYVNYLFKQTRILLIIENIQNIDNTSYKYLLDWISDTKDLKHGFIFEYTLSELHGLQDMKSLQRSISKTNAEVYECELEKIPIEYIADIIETQLENRPYDIHFTIRAQRHYNEHSDGNLWDLLDYARIYDITDNSYDLPTPTLSILCNLSYEAKYVVSILFYHSGLMSRSLLSQIWSNQFSNKSEDVLNEIINELLKSHSVCVRKSNNGDQISISHASILDVWQSSRVDFEAIDKEACKRLGVFYHGNYNGTEQIVNKQFAWQMLMRIYSSQNPDKIMELLDDFKTNVMQIISRENTWSYLELLIQHTQNRISELKDVYYKLLQICRSASLYKEGFSCIELMESQIDIGRDDKLLLNKLMYLSILDNHNLVIDIFQEAIKTTTMYSDTWITLNLLVLNSFVALNKINKCREIHKKLLSIPGFKERREYAYFLRLTNMYVNPSHAVRDARKSVKLFQKQGNKEQEGKSYITYSKLLSSLGKNKKAINTIKKANELLVNQNEGLSCIYNNLAGYLLLSGAHGPEILNFLDIAEIKSVSTYDKLSVVLNKLAWCYENKAISRLDLLENEALELIALEPSKFIHCTTFYNLHIAMQMAGEKQKADDYYRRAVELKDKCSYIKARIDGLTRKTRYIKPRIRTPYHICYLSFWVIDL